MESVLHTVPELSVLVAEFLCAAVVRVSELRDLDDLMSQGSDDRGTGACDGQCCQHSQHNVHCTLHATSNTCHLYSSTTTTSVLMPAMPTHLHRPFPRASQSSGSYVQFAVQCERLRSRLLSSRWYCRGWTTEMPSWPVFLFLPVPETAVGDERGSTAHLRPASLRPHLRRTHQPPLAPGSGESAVQDGRAHVQGHSWNRAVIPESTA